jgi:hypothetical protein
LTPLHRRFRRSVDHHFVIFPGTVGNRTIDDRLNLAVSVWRE